MKLLFCPECHDVFNLKKEEKACRCGHSRGHYTDDLNAVYSGGIPMGFVNTSLVQAIKNQPERGNGSDFIAFVIPRECPTMNKI